MPHPVKFITYVVMNFPGCFFLYFVSKYFKL